MEKICSQCQRSFEPNSSSPRQQCCGDPNCRKSWKALWQRKKRDKDPDYRENQAAAQKTWRQRNPGYSTTYRKRHPGYAEHNRQRQRERNRRRRHPETGSDFPVIGKMDRLPLGLEPLSGVYRLVPIEGQMIGKMDSAIVEIRVLSASLAPAATDGG